MQSGDFKAFIQSILDGNTSQVEYYLSEGIDPNYNHPEIMTTALVEAVRLENLEIVLTLLNYDADPKLKSIVGESPLVMAKRMKNKNLVSALKKR